jgi:hypothetical protein
MYSGDCLRGPDQQAFRKLFAGFLQTIANFCLFSPNFRKHFFGDFELFQEVARPKTSNSLDFQIFRRFVAFTRPPRISRETRNTPKRNENETKSLRPRNPVYRQALDIVIPDKSRISRF